MKYKVNGKMYTESELYAALDNTDKTEQQKLITVQSFKLGTSTDEYQKRLDKILIQSSRLSSKDTFNFLQLEQLL